MTTLLPRAPRAGRAKPRILLVDDHAAVRAQVADILADSFDIVGVAADGLEALDIAARLDPDAVVLDINMPGIDGFKTMDALARSGSRAAVVFLSLLGADEYISEALRLGGRGYVVKSRMLNDLPAALDQALLGRRFTPSLPPLLDGAGGHAMHVHANEQSFADAIVASFDAALRRGEATCLIGTASLRDRVTAQLQARGWNIGGPHGERRFRAVDTHAALGDLVRDGSPDPGKVAAVVDELDDYRRTACLAGSSATLTIGGDLSAALYATGNTAGALAIERLWNTHTAGRRFFTVCGYALSCFGDHAPDAWSTTLAEHSAVCHANDL